LGERLTPEQSNLARFIALRYRVALERAQVFVDAAYRAARDYRLDPALILAVISVESGFDPSAVSPAGAHGLMQVLTRVHVDRFQPFGGAAAAFDPIANIRVGAQILREYIARDGSVENALRAYVGAATAPDDQGYGAKVLAERARFSAVAAGRVLPVWNSAARSLPEPPRQAPASAPAHGAEDTSIPSYPTSVGASEAFLAEGQIPSLIVAN
jgi:soluble lytic murein transglycosylase-like protein